MNEYLNLLKTVQLFKNIELEDLASMLSCLDAKIIQVHKGEYIFSAGEQVEHVGIVLEGQLHIIREDVNGGRTLLSSLCEGDIFGETLCCARVPESPITVVADTNAKVMLLAFQRILDTCTNTCSFHAGLIANMLEVVAAKNLYLQNRIELISKKSIRDRCLSYLKTVAAKQGRDFSIPFNREELADYLCTDRSALSRELARLKDEGIIDYWKNQFRLL